MFEYLYLTNYQVSQVKKFLLFLLSLFLIFIILANLVYLIFGNRVELSGDSFINKEGYPFFVCEESYIEFIENYPYDPGVEIVIHEVSFGDTLWSIAVKYSVNIDTIIAANHYIDSFTLERGKKIAVPLKDGVLFPFRNYLQVLRMAHHFDYSEKIDGSRYRPDFYRIYTKDDMRLVFFEGKKPFLVSESIANLYEMKSEFQAPVQGRFSSMFGDRVDPFYHGTAFHNGIDIYNRTGTPIYPVRAGMVFSTGWRDGYGFTVMIVHGRGYSSLYAHCSKIKVEAGDWVEKDDVIALMGSTGRSTGPHLHFSMFRHGRLLDPISFVW